MTRGIMKHCVCGVFYLLLVQCIFVVVALSNSKLSIHTGMGQYSWTILNGGQPRVVKLLDNFGDAASIKKSVPGIVIVGRIYLDSQPMDGDPATRASEWWSEVSGTILSYPDVDYWEGYNEPDVGTVSAMQWYSTFEQSRIQLLDKYGLKACIGSFSTGVPDVTTPSIVEAFYPAFKTAMDFSAILGLHEYSAPYMNSSYSGGVCSGDGWLTGRYRKLFNQYLIPAGMVLNTVITENGIDGGTCSINHCNIAGGWQNFCSYWNQPSCESEYMSQLAWYDSVMQCDGYILGSTIFCIEIPGWADFDITPLTSILTSYLAA
ncbi:hypothetical protein Pelo_8558 [Pelomyxa schiedti]|nr:hypothetical protein Pelo_8558 [Pelomyxa schiedti]